MAKNTMTDRELDALNREILRENSKDARRDRFSAEIRNREHSTLAMPDLSRTAVLDAIRSIEETGAYTLPADMPKCERNSLFGPLDRLVKLRPTVPLRGGRGLRA